MSAPLVSRIVAAFCIDGSLAVLAGCLLSARWLHTTTPRLCAIERSVFQLRFKAAIVLLITLSGHLYLLTSEFSGAPTLTECLRQMPDMLSTHMGKMDAASIGLAALLVCFSRLPLGVRNHVRWSSLSFAALLCCLLLLRSASGHAGAEGELSLSVLLHAVHLCSMAVWSGSIVIAGFCVAARLTGGPDSSHALHRSHENRGDQGSSTPSVENANARIAYMSRLSSTSTWAVGLVFLSGLFKSYRALGGQAGQLRSGVWGYLLMFKTACVLIALGFGAFNRVWLNKTRSSGVADPGWTRRSLLALQLEALCMVAILALSAMLGNVDPPDIS